MITINATPAADRVILDANNTVISLTSSNGVGYYFRALIYIDGVLFDTQSWSRKTAYTCEKNLKKLYNAYFESVFSQTFTSGMTEQTALKKRVNITIHERLMADDSVIDVVSLPAFYILYNAKPTSFSDETKVAFLGMPADKILLPANGKISVPVYANTESETIVATLKDNFNNILNTETIASSTDKTVYLYNYDLSTTTLEPNTIYFLLTVTVGSTTITQAFRYLQFPDYPVKEIAYLNNFGYFVYAYLDGQMNIDRNFSQLTYEDDLGNEKNIEINEEETYSINSGSLLESEKELLTEIANALQANLYFKGEWLTMVGKIKKVKQYQDRANNYSENLIFGVKRNASIDNDGLIFIAADSDEPTGSSEPASSEVPSSRINLLSTSVSGACATLYFELYPGYEPVAVIVRLLNNDTDEIFENPGTSVSPRTRCSLTPGYYTAWIKETDTDILSNSLNFTIV